MSTCVPSSSFTCGASAPASVCAVECASDSDCESGERCQAGFCRARPIDAGPPSGRDGGFDAGRDAGESEEFDAGVDAGAPHDAGVDAGAPTDGGVDAGGPIDAGFDAFVPGDGGPGDGGLPPLVIAPTDTVTVFPSVLYEDSASAGPCPVSCDEDGFPAPVRVFPFSISAPMQFTSWFRRAITIGPGSEQSLRQGATCISSAVYPGFESRVLPAGTYEAVVCTRPFHMMVVEPVPVPTAHTSCATALPIDLGDVVDQPRDASATRLHYRLTVPTDYVWDGFEAMSATMDSAGVTLTVRRVCDDPSTTLDTVDVVYVDAFGGFPFGVGPFGPGVYELILDVPAGLALRFIPVQIF